MNDAIKLRSATWAGWLGFGVLAVLLLIVFLWNWKRNSKKAIYFSVCALGGYYLAFLCYVVFFPLIGKAVLDIKFIDDLLKDLPEAIYTLIKDPKTLGVVATNIFICALIWQIIFQIIWWIIVTILYFTIFRKVLGIKKTAKVKAPKKSALHELDKVNHAAASELSAIDVKGGKVRANGKQPLSIRFVVSLICMIGYIPNFYVWAGTADMFANDQATSSTPSQLMYNLEKNTDIFYYHPSDGKKLLNIAEKYIEAFDNFDMDTFVNKLGIDKIGDLVDIAPILDSINFDQIISDVQNKVSNGFNSSAYESQWLGRDPSSNLIINATAYDSSSTPQWDGYVPYILAYFPIIDVNDSPNTLIPGSGDIKTFVAYHWTPSAHIDSTDGNSNDADVQSVATIEEMNNNNTIDTTGTATSTLSFITNPSEYILAMCNADSTVPGRWDHVTPIPSPLSSPFDVLPVTIQTRITNTLTGAAKCGNLSIAKMIRYQVDDLCDTLNSYLNSDASNPNNIMVKFKTALEDYLAKAFNVYDPVSNSYLPSIGQAFSTQLSDKGEQGKRIHFTPASIMTEILSIRMINNILTYFAEKADLSSLFNVKDLLGDYTAQLYTNIPIDLTNFNSIINNLTTSFSTTIDTFHSNLNTKIDAFASIDNGAPIDFNGFTNTEGATSIFDASKFDSEFGDVETSLNSQIQSITQQFNDILTANQSENAAIDVFTEIMSDGLNIFDKNYKFVSSTEKVVVTKNLYKALMKGIDNQLSSFDKKEHDDIKELIESIFGGIFDTRDSLGKVWEVVDANDKKRW